MAPITNSIALAGALFAFSGFAAPANSCVTVWETVDVSTGYNVKQDTATTDLAVATTTPKVEPTAAAAAATLREHDATISVSVAASAPTQRTGTRTTAPMVQATAYTSSIVPTVSAATSPYSTSSIASTGHTGSCSEAAPCTGDITYYDTATTASNPSSCGTTNDGITELVLALPHGIMTDLDCGKSVTITYNGISKTGTVVDKCNGCDNNSIDLSRALFEAVVGSLDAGCISGVEWYIK